MKLCFLAQVDSPHSLRWIRYFQERGHDIYCISFLPKNGLSIPFKNANLYLLRFLRVGTFLKVAINAVKVRQLIKEIKPDILHAHYAGTYGLLGALSGFHPLVITAWGSDVLISAKSKLKRIAIKHNLKTADLITCDAYHMKNAIADLLDDNSLLNDDSKIKIINFGVEVDQFKPALRDRKLQEELGIKGCPIVISLRNLQPIYNIETLIKAMPIVLKEIPDTKFIIGGEGAQKRNLQLEAKKLGVGSSAIFTGVIPHGYIPQYLNLADVYVSTSSSDAGIAASTAEAMACGVPVVVSDSGENGNWIKDDNNGFLFPVGDYRFLAEKIIYLLKNKDVARSIGLKGRVIIEEKNNYQKEMDKMEKLYESLI